MAYTKWPGAFMPKLEWETSFVMMMYISKHAKTTDCMTVFSSDKLQSYYNISKLFLLILDHCIQAIVPFNIASENIGELLKVF